jgi:hypothetical protein
MDIRTLRNEGHSIKAIARLTGHSRNTVRRVLREAGPSAEQSARACLLTRDSHPRLPIPVPRPSRGGCIPVWAR